MKYIPRLGKSGKELLLVSRLVKVADSGLSVLKALRNPNSDLVLRISEMTPAMTIDTIEHDPDLVAANVLGQWVAAHSRVCDFGNTSRATILQAIEHVCCSAIGVGDFLRLMILTSQVKIGIKRWELLSYVR